MMLDGFYGNAALKNRLKAAIKEGTLSHALLIEGEKGLGVGFLSRLIAASVLCERGGCGECLSCRKAMRSIHPDIITLDRQGEAIKVDDIRYIGETAAFYPNDAERKVYIIKHAEKMNAAAQNALLKLLEEPPSFVTFILCTENRYKLLDTVLSRCVCLKVYPVSADEVTKYLTSHEGMKPAEAQSLSELSYGFIGRALTLQGKRELKRDSERREFCLEFSETLCFGREYDFLKLSKRFASERDKIKKENEDPALMFDMTERLLSDVLHVLRGFPVLSYSSERERLLRLGGRLTEQKISRLYMLCEDAKQQISRNINFNACINTFLVRAWEAIND